MSKIINGMKVAYNSKDWTGQVIGRLKIKELVGRHPTRRTLIWAADCSCGNQIEVAAAELSVGDTKSCGCLFIEARKERNEIFAKENKTHGMAGTREQMAWKRIKQRCCNPNSKEYEKYSKIGICEEFKESFLNFYNHIGPIPDGLEGRVSVDRIDNTKGYVLGNVRWSNDEGQARNKGMYSNNSSGVNGVYYHVGATGLEYWTASWYDGANKQKSKYFSIKKLGNDLAFEKACQYREEMFKMINEKGAGYSLNHGKPKENTK